MVARSIPFSWAMRFASGDAFNIPGDCGFSERFFFVFQFLQRFNRFSSDSFEQVFFEELILVINFTFSGDDGDC